MVLLLEPLCQNYSNPGLQSCFEGYLFDVNSYWIYQDTTTLQLDSVYVWNWDTISGANPAYCIVQNHCWIYLSNYKRMGLYSAAPSEGYDGCFQVGGWEGGGVNFCDFCSNPVVIDSIQVNGVMYYDVIEIEDSYNNNFFYYKENIGLLREVNIYNNDTTTRDLINYQVTLFPNPF